MFPRPVQDVERKHRHSMKTTKNGFTKRENIGTPIAMYNISYYTVLEINHNYFNLKQDGELCPACAKVILGQRVVFNDFKFHKNCFTCTEPGCDVNLLDENIQAKMNMKRRLYCMQHFLK